MSRPLYVTPLLLLATLASATAGAQITETLPRSSGAPRVLLLGTETEALAAELEELGVRVGSAGAELGSFRGLREDASTRGAIAEGGWDVVLLAGDPFFGRTLIIEGEIRVGDPSEMLHQGRLLLEEVRRAGARPVVLVPPLPPDASVVDRQAVAWAYHHLGRTGGAAVAPVADAFERARRRRPDLPLFDPHGERWSPAGARLAAGVVAATLTGRPPVREPSAATPDDSETERVHDLELLLNEAGWAAVRDLVDSGGHREAPPPLFPPTPSLPRGDLAIPAELQGVWRGPLRLYPWDAELVLEIAVTGADLRVAGHIAFPGGRPPLTLRPSSLRVDTHRLSFRNPTDLAGGRTRYQLVRRGDLLTGTAELTTEDGSIYAIGGLDLVRDPPAAAPAPSRGASRPSTPEPQKGLPR